MAEKIGSALVERHLRVHAINRRGRGDDDFFDAIFPGRFEQVDRAFDVDALVKRRLGEAGPHAGPRSEVDDLVELHAAEQFVERRAVAQVAMDEFEGFGQRLDVAEVPAFELRVVKRVEVIEGPDGVAVMQQPFADMRTDEAGAAGDQKIHGETLATSAPGVERTEINPLAPGEHPTQRTAAPQKNQVMPTIPAAQFKP